MKTGPKSKRIATAEEVVRLAKKMKWSDIKSADGQIVEAKTIRELFALAEAGLKKEKRRSRAHAAVT